jgi:hypothetical protein
MVMDTETRGARMLTRSILTTVVALAFAAALAACGGNDEAEPSGAPADDAEQVVVALHEQSGSGQTGTMTLEPAGEGRTRVVLEVTQADVPQPAHIHAGSCANLDPAPAYGLPNVVDGRSESTVEASIDELVEGEFAVNVHRSDGDLETYVACGDIDGDADASADPRDY